MAVREEGAGFGLGLAALAAMMLVWFAAATGQRRGAALPSARRDRLAHDRHAARDLHDPDDGHESRDRHDPRDRRTSSDHAPKSDHPDAQRGRDATTPSEIPARGWWEILKRVVSDVSDNRLMTESAGVTFYVLLSIFPALAALVSLAGFFIDPKSISTDLNAVSGIVPGGGMDIIRDQITRLASTSSRALGLSLFTGLAISLWSANQGIKALFDALNSVYDEREKRGYFKRTVLSFCFTIGALVFVLLAMVGVVVLPVALGFVGLGGTADLLLRLARWPVLLVAITFFLALIYRFGPSRESAQWRWVTWGSAFAAIVWVLGSAAFSWYVANFGSYNKTYGSLGAVIGFMTWIWLSGLVVLVGAQLDAEMEHETEHDTTTGAPAPRGHRGAVKADTVAA